MQGKEQIDSLPFKGRARVGMGCEVQPLLASPKGRGQKWIKKRNLSERSELFRFPFLSSPFWAPAKRATTGGRLSLLPFFGEAKKGSGPPGPVPASSIEEMSVLHHRRKN